VIAYVDTSVLLSSVFAQGPDPVDWRSLDGLFSSELLEIEGFRTVDRFRRSGFGDDETATRQMEAVKAWLRRIDLVPVSPQVLRRAGDAFRTSLKTLDAVHLATALLWEHDNGPLDVFLTHDEQLGRAARAYNIRVLGCEADAS